MIVSQNGSKQPTLIPAIPTDPKDPNLGGADALTDLSPESSGERTYARADNSS
jgi:hypothetical protein